MSKLDEEYKALGKAVFAVHEIKENDLKRVLKISFLKGLVSGLGGVIGATILVALLLWVLTLFGELPIIGRFADKLNNTVQKEGL